MIAKSTLAIPFGIRVSNTLLLLVWEQGYGVAESSAEFSENFIDWTWYNQWPWLVNQWHWYIKVVCAGFICGVGKFHPVATKRAVEFDTLLAAGWRRLIGSRELQIIFHERATKYRSLLRKMTCKDKGSYESSSPCMRRVYEIVHIVCVGMSDTLLDILRVCVMGVYL